MKAAFKNIPGIVGTKSLALVAAATIALSMGPVAAAPFTLDGVNNGDSYTNSFVAKWNNGHKNEYSVYGDAGDDKSTWSDTTVQYGTGTKAGATSDSFFLFVEVPIYAKNMVWGAGAASFIGEYQDHWLTHHSGTLNIDYNGATGSEKAIFAGITADLNGSASGGFGLIDSKNSRDYLVDDALVCDTTDCLASTTTMSFELEFALDATDNAALIAAIQGNGIEFHLSPERRGEIPTDAPPPATEVAEPGMLAIFALGLAGLGYTRRKRRV